MNKSFDYDLVEAKTTIEEPRGTQSRNARAIDPNALTTHAPVTRLVRTASVDKEATQRSQIAWTHHAACSNPAAVAMQ